MKYIVKPYNNSYNAIIYGKCNRDCILRCWEFFRY